MQSVREIDTCKFWFGSYFTLAPGASSLTFAKVPPFDWQPVWLSLRVALCALLLVATSGITLGRFFATRRFRGQKFVEALFLLPLVLPPVVSGFVLLVLLGRRGFLGAYLWETARVQLLFSPFAGVLASALVACPLMFSSARAAFSGADRELEFAARSLGASPWRAFISIALPLAAPGLWAGLSLSFARALGEFGATILVAGNIEGKTTTVSTAIFMAAQSGDYALAARYCAVLAIVNIAFVVAAQTSSRSRRR